MSSILAALNAAPISTSRPSMICPERCGKILTRLANGLAPKAAVKDIANLSLHNGTAKYYKENGVL